MLVDTIKDYLKSNRRLVIPSFGAFIVKESGEIIFSELLKRDDGVLRTLLISQGLREIEAAARIDRFIFECRHALQQSGVCPVAEFGTFRRDSEGVITFDSTIPARVAIPLQDVAQVPAQNPIPQSQPRTQTNKQHKRPRKYRGGFVMWFAWTVIILSLAALGYGIYCMATAPKENIEAQMDAQRIPMIQVPEQQ